MCVCQGFHRGSWLREEDGTGCTLNVSGAIPQGRVLTERWHPPSFCFLSHPRAPPTCEPAFTAGTCSHHHALSPRPLTHHAPSPRQDGLTPPLFSCYLSGIWWQLLPVVVRRKDFPEAFRKAFCKCEVLLLFYCYFEGGDQNLFVCLVNIQCDQVFQEHLSLNYSYFNFKSYLILIGFISKLRPSLYYVNVLFT